MAITPGSRRRRDVANESLIASRLAQPPTTILDVAAPVASVPRGNVVDEQPDLGRYEAPRRKHPTPSGAKITFTHAGFADAEHPAYAVTIGENGWGHFMPSPQNYLDKGTGQPW